MDADEVEEVCPDDDFVVAVDDFERVGPRSFAVRCDGAGHGADALGGGRFVETVDGGRFTWRGRLDVVLQLCSSQKAERER